MAMSPIPELIDEIRQGKMVILVDDEDRENEGDLIIAAEQVRPEDINFMATHARGLICMTMTGERCEQLNLPLMVQDNRAQHTTNFTVSIEATEGVTTGISAADRARTVRAAVARHAKASDIVQPGHIFPLRAQPGGVLSRAGHTEAGSDLARLAGFEAASVIVEIMNEDGTMARRDDLEVFAEKHGLKMGTIADLIHYRASTEKTIECIATLEVYNDFGEFTLKTYRDSAREENHLVFIKGDVPLDNPALVRVHVTTRARDMFGIKNKDDEHEYWTVQRAMKQIADEGAGILVVLCHNEDFAELDSDIDLIQQGKPPVALAPDNVKGYREVGTGSQILKDIGVTQMRLMSAPVKFNALSGWGLEVVEYITYQDN